MIGSANAGASTSALAARTPGSGGDAVMTITPDTQNDLIRKRQDGEESVLPLAIRQRLWDQLWTRLLAPPVDPADKAPAPRDRASQDGDPR